MTILKSRLRWDKARLIASLIHDYFGSSHCSGTCDLLYSMYRNEKMSFASNKVLTSLTYMLKDCCGYSDNIIDFRISRYETYMEACRELSSAFNEADIDFAIIKTIKPIPLDIADIDLLVNEGDKRKAVDVLKTLGYRLRKESIRQDLWSKTKDGVIVDVELHTSVAMAGYTYIENEFILKNTVMENGVVIPRNDIELVLEAAHAVLKDLEARLSDLLSIAFRIKKYLERYQLEPLVQRAADMGLSVPLKYMLYLSAYILSRNDRFAKASMLGLPIALPKDLPSKPPIHILAYSFLEKTNWKIRYMGLSRTLNELGTLLKSKGVDALMTYLTRETIVKGILEDMSYSKVTDI